MSLLTAPLHPEIAWPRASAGAFATALQKAADRWWNQHGDLLPWLDLVLPLTLAPDTLWSWGWMPHFV